MLTSVSGWASGIDIVGRRGGTTSVPYGRRGGTTSVPYGTRPLAGALFSSILAPELAQLPGLQCPSKNLKTYIRPVFGVIFRPLTA